MYGPFVCAFVDPSSRTIVPAVWRDTSNRMPDAASVNGIGEDNHMWQALDADKRVELLQLAATNVAAANGIANSADFRIAAKILEVQNPFDVVPVKIGSLTSEHSSGGDTLVVWTRAEFAEGGSSVVFKPFVEVVFAGTCVLVAYNQGAPVNLLHPLYEYITPWWLDKPLVGRSLDGGRLAFAWMDERFGCMHHSTSVPGADGKSHPTCTVCGRPSTHGCPHCGAAYCHSLCQREDWARHRLECEHHPSSQARVDARGRPLFWSKMAALTLGVSRQQNNNATLFRECVAIGVSASVLTSPAVRVVAIGVRTPEKSKKEKKGAKEEEVPEVVVVPDDDGEGVEESAPDLDRAPAVVEPIDDVVARINSVGKKQRAPATASKGKGKSRGARVREAKKRNQETESETSSRQLRALLR